MINSPQDETVLRRLQQAPWRTQTQGTSLVLAAVVLVGVIGALYLAQASRTAAAGRRLQNLESERQRLEQQNAQLRAEIAALRSVPRLIGEAQALGYHQASASEVDYLTVRGVSPPTPDVIGAQPAPPTAEESADQEVFGYDETLESYLSEHFSDFREQFLIFWQNTFGSGAPAQPEALPTLTPTPTRVP